MGGGGWGGGGRWQGSVGSGVSFIRGHHNIPIQTTHKLCV